MLIVSGYFCLQSTSCSPASNIIIKALYTHIIVWMEKLYSKFQCLFPNRSTYIYSQPCLSLVPRPYFFLLLSLFIHKHKKDIVRQQRKKWAYS